MRRGVIGAFFLTLLAFPASALAAPPNDDFADRQVLTGAPLPIQVTGSNVEATKESGEHLGGLGPAGHSVWFEWEAPNTGWYTFGACSMSFAGTIRIYTGTEVDELVALPQGNRNEGPDCAYRQRQYSFEATAGTDYVIGVDGDLFSVDGSVPDTEGLFTLDIEATRTPSNDDFADALPLDGTTNEEPGGDRFYFARAPGFNWTASSEPGEPDVAETAGATVWYRWTAPESGIARASANGGLPVRIYTGVALDGLTPVAVGGTFGGEFEVTEGGEYAIAVDANLSELGGEPETSFFELMVSMVLTPTPQVQSETVTRIETVVTEDRTPPKTTIRWHRSSGGQGATFVLRSNEPGTSFRCRLDGRRLPCRTTVSFKKLRPGRHTFEVSAIDAAGNADPSPAVTHFKIPPPYPRHHS
jgi:hypothetical protein